MEKHEDHAKESENYTEIKVSVLGSNTVKNENCECILNLSSVGITWIIIKANFHYKIV